MRFAVIGSNFHFLSFSDKIKVVFESEGRRQKGLKLIKVKMRIEWVVKLTYRIATLKR